MNVMRTFPLAVAATLAIAVGPALAQTTIDELLPGGVYDPDAPSWKGQSGFTFLQIPGSARAAALGGAFSGAKADVSSVFYNPAGAAAITGTGLYVGHTDWLVDMTLVDLAVIHDFGMMSLGVAYHGMDYGPIQGTVVRDGTPNYASTGDIDGTAYSLGVVAAAKLTDRFHAGFQFKYVVQDFDGSSVWSTIIVPSGYLPRAVRNRVAAPMFDVGTQYNTGLRGLHVNMSLQHYGQRQQYTQEFDLPLTYRVGFSGDALMFVTGEENPAQKINLYIDGVDRRDVTLDAAIGVEYFVDLSSTMEGLTVSLRAGRRAAKYQEGEFTAGAGATIPVPTLETILGFDYAYADYGEHFSAHHFGFHFRL